MRLSTKNPRKKSRGRPAIGVGVQVNTMLRPEQAALLDAWIAKQPNPKPTRPEAIRRLIQKALGKTTADELLTSP
jgi:hypothetical protein